MMARLPLRFRYGAICYLDGDRGSPTGYDCVFHNR